MYGKLFESMYDGTLSGNWKALITFQQLIILADKDGYVDITPAALSRRTGIPIEIIEHGIEELEQPDKDSRSDTSDGRRIVRLDDHRPWGWQIVNYEKYRDLYNADDRREKNRARQQKHRDRQKGKEGAVTDSNADVTHDNAALPMSRHVDVDVKANGNAKEKENKKTASSISIPLKDGTDFVPDDKDIQVWQAAFPTLDIQERLKYISAWNHSNPTKQKTRSGIKRHIFYMLPPKADNHGGSDDVDPNEGRHIAL